MFRCILPMQAGENSVPNFDHAELCAEFNNPHLSYYDTWLAWQMSVLDRTGIISGSVYGEPGSVMLNPKDLELRRQKKFKRLIVIKTCSQCIVRRCHITEGISNNHRTR